MFSSHTLRRNQSPVIFDLRLRKTWSEKSPDFRDAIVLEKFHFQYDFRPHENEKPTFLNISDSKTVLKKLRFRCG